MIPFRPGDLVIAGGTLKRVEQVFTIETTGADPVLMTSHGAEHPEDCRLVTVSMAFALAGFPVEEGAKIHCYESRWMAHDYEHNRARDFQGMWFDPHYLTTNPIQFLQVDLNRLPAFDAWDVLPGIVRERAEALVGQEVSL